MTTHEEQTMTDPSTEPPSPVAETSRAEGESRAVTPDQADSVTAADVESPAAEHAPSADEAPSAGNDLADLADLRARWAGVQAAFVDDPKDCVQKADALVSDLVEQLTSGFTQARSRLEEQWARGKEASTEDLRLALMHYREFFERLLAI